MLMDSSAELAIEERQRLGTLARRVILAGFTSFLNVVRDLVLVGLVPGVD